MAAWPDGPRLLEHLRDLQAPLRLPDLHPPCLRPRARLLVGPDAVERPSRAHRCATGTSPSPSSSSRRSRANESSPSRMRRC